MPHYVIVLGKAIDVIVINPEFPNFLIDFKCLFTCLDDSALFLELFTLTITVCLLMHVKYIHDLCSLLGYILSYLIIY
jgi:hypothetical protein